MLKITGLRGGYGAINVLQGIDLEIKQGDFLGILGHNGMGKSTLMKMLIGLLKPTSGQISLMGKDISRLSPHQRARAGIGYVPQGRQIFGQLTVRENLEVAARAASQPLTNVERMLDELPTLSRLSSQKGGGLSGGEQQILALGRCLCTGPKLVLLDEPTEGVQPSIVDQMADILAHLHKSWGLSTILVEQNLDFILALSERVAILERGRVVREISRQEAGDVDQLSALMGFSY